MSRLTRRLALAAILLGLSASPLALQAQQSPRPTPPATPEPEKEQVTELSPFIISDTRDQGYYSEQTLLGARYGKSIFDIPGNVTIINKQLLDDLAAYDMIEPLKYAVSGVTVNQPDSDDFNIRGFRTRGGMRNGRASAFAGFASSTWDVERIEVLKGPGGMLTGINSTGIGGVVNYISQRPTEVRRTVLSAQVAGEGEYRVQAVASGPLAKHGDTKLLYLANIGNWDRGFDSDFAAWDERFASFSFAAKFSPTSVLYLTYTDLDRTSKAVLDKDLTDPVAYAAGRFELRKDVRRSTNLRGPGDKNDLINRYVEVEFTHKVSDYFSARVSYQHTLEAYDWRYVTYTGYQANSANTVMNRTGAQSVLRGKGNMVQLDLLSNFRTGPLAHQLSGGADYNQGNTKQEYFNQWTMPSVNIRTPDFSQDLAVMRANVRVRPGNFPNEQTRRISTLYQYYIQENLTFWKDRITLVSGFRWLDSFATTQNFGTGLTSSTNPKLFRIHRHGVIVKPLPNVSVYGLTSANHFVSSGLTRNAGTPFQFVDPDSDGQVDEIGIKVSALNGRLYGTAAAFDLARTNVRTAKVVTFPDGSVRTIDWVDDVTTKGWEADLGARFKMTLGTADFIVSYYDAESTTPPPAGVSVRRPAYNAPTYIRSITSKFSFSESALKGLSVGLSVRKESQVYMVTNTVVNRRPGTGTLFLSYPVRKDLMVNLNVDNITDEEYVISGGPAWGDAALGRNFRLSAKYSF